jgi:hypothetical protein
MTAMTDKQCQDMVEQLIEQHLTEEIRIPILKWLANLIAVQAAFKDIGLLP